MAFAFADAKKRKAILVCDEEILQWRESSVLPDFWKPGDLVKTSTDPTVFVVTRGYDGKKLHLRPCCEFISFGRHEAEANPDVVNEYWGVVETVSTVSFLLTSASNFVKHRVSDCIPKDWEFTVLFSDGRLTKMGLSIPRKGANCASARHVYDEIPLQYPPDMLWEGLQRRHLTEVASMAEFEMMLPFDVVGRHELEHFISHSLPPSWRGWAIPIFRRGVSWRFSGPASDKNKFLLSLAVFFRGRMQVLHGCGGAGRRTLMQYIRTRAILIALFIRKHSDHVLSVLDFDMFRNVCSFL